MDLETVVKLEIYRLIAGTRRDAGDPLFHRAG